MRTLTTRGTEPKGAKVFEDLGAGRETHRQGRATLPGSEERALQFEETRRAAAGCQACDLWARATQTVFGAGPTPAPLMLLGEQPGDREDLAGQPFVGPAGRVLDEALAA